MADHFHAAFNVAGRRFAADPYCTQAPDAALAYLTRELARQRDTYTATCRAGRRKPGAICCGWCKTAETIATVINEIAGVYGRPRFGRDGVEVCWFVSPPGGPDTAFWAADAPGDRATCRHNNDQP